MNVRLPHILSVLGLVAACQTPPPVVQEAFDDEVIVAEETAPAEPVEAAAPPVEEPPPPPPVEAPSEPPTEMPATFVEEPTVPSGLSFQETALVRTVGQIGKGLTFQPIVAAECGTPTAIRALANIADEDAGYTVDSCSRVVDGAHAQTFKRHLTRVGVIDVSSVSIRHNGEAIWTATDICSSLRQDGSACPSDFAHQGAEARSMVGPLLTYVVWHYEARAGGHAHAHTEPVVIDVRTRQPAKFDALVDADSILNALKRDSFLRRAVNPTELDAAKTIEDVWKLWRTEDFASFGGYYFAEWDAERGQAAMRVLFLEDSFDHSPGRLKELGLWVTPKPQWRSAFEDAASGESGWIGH